LKNAMPVSQMDDWKSTKVLISACLLGKKVRYDGNGNLVHHAVIEQLQEQNRLVELCPEVAGGLPVPREKCEILAEITETNFSKDSRKVIGESGTDRTEAFRLGAEAALNLVMQHDIKVAILKAKSPSCGNKKIYDGSFSGVLVAGQGMTSSALSLAGVQVFNENELDDLLPLLFEK